MAFFRRNREVKRKGKVTGSGLERRKLAFSRQWSKANLLADAATPDQWRKCRTPVKAIAIPRAFAAAITALSRTEPPG